MTYQLPELQHLADLSNETQAAIDAGTALAGPRPVDSDGHRFHTQLVLEGASLQVFDEQELDAKFEDTYGLRPRRKTGTVHVQDGRSFIDYIAKHGLPETEVYADLSRMKLCGVINAHTEASDDVEQAAGHGDHRVNLDLVHTDAWKVWTGLDKKAMTQQQFAEHLEDRAVDVTDPSAADMLEVAQTLIATVGVDFKSGHRLADGQVQFRYEETVSSRAGQKGDIEIPQTFTIAIPPFEGCSPVEVTARFRYRITSSGLSLFYALLNPQDLARATFQAYVETVAEAVTQPVFRGRPE